MAECEYRAECHFFVQEVGYSPEMQHTMRERYCMTDNSECARLAAMEYLELDEIPDDLIPTDFERLEQLVAEKASRER